MEFYVDTTWSERLFPIRRVDGPIRRRGRSVTQEVETATSAGPPERGSVNHGYDPRTKGTGRQAPGENNSRHEDAPA